MITVLGVLLAISIGVTGMILSAWMTTVNKRITNIERRLDKQNTINQIFEVKDEYKEWDYD